MVAIFLIILKALDMECHGTYNSRPLDEVNVSKVDISDYASVENWVNSILENSNDKKLIVLSAQDYPSVNSRINLIQMPGKTWSMLT